MVYDICLIAGNLDQSYSVYCESLEIPWQHPINRMNRSTYELTRPICLPVDKLKVKVKWNHNMNRVHVLFIMYTVDKRFYTRETLFSSSKILKINYLWCNCLHLCLFFIVCFSSELNILRQGTLGLIKHYTVETIYHYMYY